MVLTQILAAAISGLATAFGYPIVLKYYPESFYFRTIYDFANFRNLLIIPTGITEFTSQNTKEVSLCSLSYPNTPD